MARPQVHQALQRRTHVIDGEEDYVRSVVESLLPLLLSEQDHMSSVFRLLAREVLTRRVVRGDARAHARPRRILRSALCGGGCA